jgi:hypothetical protein
MTNKYKKEYMECKRRYLELKRAISSEGISPEGDIDIEYIKDDKVIKSTEPSYSYTIPEEEEDTVSILKSESQKEAFTRENVEKDVGLFGKARGKSFKKYKFTDVDFTTINKKPNKDKILLIDNVDDFDIFTDKYGSLEKYEDEDKEYGEQTVLYINWDNVANDYKGIFLDDGIKADRFTKAYYKGETYSSWWESSFDFEDVLIFSGPEDAKPAGLPDGKPITKPFKGLTYGENDFTEDDYILIQEKDPTKILILDKIEAFDQFTNKYGRLHRLKKKYNIRIDWDKVNADYKGFYVDKDNTYKSDRYKTAFYEGTKYPSWWKGEKIKGGIVYVFS